MTHPAQIVFTEHPTRLDCWQGRLLRRDRVIDAAHNPPRPIEGTPRWDIEKGTHSYSVTMQGGAKGGRRYRTFATLDEAQQAGIRWAARRFRVEG